jgi:hypothetical protein
MPLRSSVARLRRPKGGDLGTAARRPGRGREVAAVPGTRVPAARRMDRCRPRANPHLGQMCRQTIGQGGRLTCGRALRSRAASGRSCPHRVDVPPRPLNRPSVAPRWIWSSCTTAFNSWTSASCVSPPLSTTTMRRPWPRACRQVWDPQYGADDADVGPLDLDVSRRFESCQISDRW